MTKHRNPLTDLNKDKLKSLKSYFDSQKEVFKHYLSENIATCSMVANQTGIPQKNLTRYKTELEDKSIDTNLKNRKANMNTKSFEVIYWSFSFFSFLSLSALAAFIRGWLVDCLVLGEHLTPYLARASTCSDELLHE